jgi:thioredoxin 1
MFKLFLTMQQENLTGRFFKIIKKSVIMALIFVPFLLTECGAVNPEEPKNNSGSDGQVISMTNETFKKLIFNYEANKEWKFEGNKPAIIDFYADWCPPCRQLSPLVEEIAKEYSGKIDVYKVNTDKEKVLAQNLGITGLPTLLFIPAKGKPQITMGALPKENLLKAVDEILLVKTL